MLSQTLAITFLLFIGIFPNPDFKENKPSTITAIDPVSVTYDGLHIKDGALPSKEVFTLAIQGWTKMRDNLTSKVLTVIDFSLPSTAKRMWIIDPEKGEILLNSVVSHGRNSGDLMANNFSNIPESFKSSLGFYKTAETYSGKHGYSLRLDGLEKGFNDQARNRAIVIHGADYAKEEFAKSVGRLGRSLGCPALPSELSARAIDLIKNGSLLFIFGQDDAYLSKSSLIKA
ncbi:murein L,D-transpeptidase catalytic domain family protein [Algoriphagus sp. C2-6-M1]|uniref:murein L,D-transpeptidase catalytic domain family protein n=1 Tax=Algoriphagus persicinus TaxID=3108754 RepID=UPI002B3B5EE7|nr:murein L,D-transpeptidase catalytic domain family protein [Algoriphagus sp. C2-6-M1]MEB2780949.1 murein L,D-transpeptidase catalytic domain family protein [Algoriphagus sp. C2-6-M1]